MPASEKSYARRAFAASVLALQRLSADPGPSPEPVLEGVTSVAAALELRLLLLLLLGGAVVAALAESVGRRKEGRLEMNCTGCSSRTAGGVTCVREGVFLCSRLSGMSCTPGGGDNGLKKCAAKHSCCCSCSRCGLS